MINNEIVSAARAAGIDSSDESITLFAAHIAKLTREECAQQVEDEVHEYWEPETRRALVNAASVLLREATT